MQTRSKAKSHQQTIHPHVNLNTLPTDIINDLVPYLDVGDLVSIAQTTVSLRRYLVQHNTLWSYLLRNRMQIKHGPRSKRKPYEEIDHRIPSRRCAGCKSVEQQPWFHGLFQARLCKGCRLKPEYTLITVTKAKQEYYLNENDLASLRVLKVKNPHYSCAAKMRLYCLKEVKDVSEAKMEVLQTTVVDRKRKAEEIGEVIRERKRVAVERRRQDLADALAKYGLVPMMDDGMTETFYENSWRRGGNGGYGESQILDIDGMVQRSFKHHYVFEHSAYLSMGFDVAWIRRLERYYHSGVPDWLREHTAMEHFERVEEEVAGENPEASVCSCGKKNLQSQITARWINDFAHRPEPESDDELW